MATTTLKKTVYGNAPEDAGNGPASFSAQVSEWGWFLLSLLLFLILGPFSSPVVLLVLGKLSLEDISSREPESVGPR